MKTLNEYVSIYTKQLEKGDIQKAYMGLLKYMMSLKSSLQNKLSDKFSFGNMSPGYMDYTYFSFFDNYLRSKNLRFGIVLNHEKARFELWLMGQNNEVKSKYWNLFKTTKWVEDKAKMPKYPNFEIILVENPNFDKLDALTHEIEKNAVLHSNEIIDFLNTHEIE